MNPTHALILKLWREGKAIKELPALVGPKWSYPRLSNFLNIARDLLGESVVPLHLNTSSSDPLLEQIAELWRQGLSAYEIGAKLKLFDAPSLVQKARKRLGVIAVPIRKLDKAVKPIGPLTMVDAGRHFLRLVGDEYIFRNENGKEEVWVRGEKGLILHRASHSIPLVFRNVMGMTEARNGKTIPAS